jgi:hypothetical protein
MQQFLKNIGEAHEANSSIETGPSTSQTRGEPEASEWDTVHTIP